MAEQLLTRAECELILAQAMDDTVQLQSYELLPALNAIGYLGEYFQLTLNYLQTESLNNNNNKVERRIQLFVKTLPQPTTEHEKEVIFKKESQLYATLLKELSQFSTEVWCAKAYYTRDDLIVLQDLQQLGYDTCQSNAESLSEFEMKPILRGLAALHAASIAYEVHSGINIGSYYQQMLVEITVAAHVSWYTTGLRAMLALAKKHPKYQSANMQDFIVNRLPQQLERFYDMVEPSTKYRNVLCHRDSWRGNVFLHRSNKPEDAADRAAILVDYQISRYSPACIDLLLVIFMNLEEQERQRMETAYLKYYYQHFRQNLLQQGIHAEQHMTELDLFSSYKEFLTFGYFYKILAATILKVPKSLVTNHYKLVDRTQTLLEYMQTNASYRTFMEQCVDDMLQLLL